MSEESGSDRLATDVLVVGGGTAGVTAALSAARKGAQVVVVERDSALGGVATRAGIHIYYYGRSAGVQKEIDARTRELGHALAGKPPGFHPEARRMVINEALREAGCRILFQTVATKVLRDDRKVRGIMAETPDGPLRIEAKVTIDATGDADVCAMAGVPFTYGRDWDGVTNNYSLVPRYLHEGRIHLWNFDGGWVDSTSTEDMTRACIEGRRHLRERTEQASLTPENFVSIAPQVGVREGRLIFGDYRLTLEDLALGRQFHDAVMQVRSHYDTHAYDYANENLVAQIWTCILGFWRQPIGCDVPYRCFLPQGVDGLLIGCRAVSQTRDSSMAFRMQRDIMQAGEVAGTAAALSVLHGCEPRTLDVGELQACLVEQGVLEPGQFGGNDEPWIRFETATGQVDPDPTTEALIAALGTEREGAALWLLWRRGEAVIPALRQRLNQCSGKQARGIALALALLGSADGADLLTRAVGERDERVDEKSRAPAPWIACLIALRLLQHPGAARQIAAQLPAEADSRTALHMLHYLIAAAPALSAETRADVVAGLDRYLQRSDLGDEYQLWGGVRASLRWSIELTAAALWAALGNAGRAKALLVRYRGDERVFVQRAAQHIEARIVEVSV